MRMLRVCSIAALMLATTGGAGIDPAMARRARHAIEIVPSQAVCPLPPSPLWVYPVANWRPFFRRHVYRYGPIDTLCSIATEPQTWIQSNRTNLMKNENEGY